MLIQKSESSGWSFQHSAQYVVFIGFLLIADSSRTSNLNKKIVISNSYLKNGTVNQRGGACTSFVVSAFSTQRSAISKESMNAMDRAERQTLIAPLDKTDRINKDCLSSYFNPDYRVSPV